MAKKRKPIIEDDDEETPEQLELELITAPKLNSLMRKLRSATARKDEAVAEIRGHIANAVEKDNVDKIALAEFRKFANMEDDKLRRVYGQFIHMMRVSGTLARAAMPGRDEVDPVPAEAEEDTNILKIGRGRRQLQAAE